MTAAILFLAFVAAFALFPKAVRGVGDVMPAIVKFLVVLAVVGWVGGAVLQLVQHGAITTPCCQLQ